jgi:hypothetical protein
VFRAGAGGYPEAAPATVAGAGINPAREDIPVYIGIGTIVLIVIIVLVILLIRRGI